METSTKWAIGIGSAAAALTGAVLLLRRRGSQSSFGAAGKEPGVGEVTLRGTLDCPIYRRYEVGGSSHLTRTGEYPLPARVQVRCRGEGEQRRCTASYPVCPGSVRGYGPVLEGEEQPTAVVQRKIAGLHAPDGVARGRDRSGNWNTSIEWVGKAGWDRNERKNEEFSLQAWDDHGEPTDPLRNAVFFRGAAFRRPFPRGELYYESDADNINTGTGGRAALLPALRSAAAKSVGRYGSISSAELQESPPIRLGGAELDLRRALPTG